MLATAASAGGCYQSKVPLDEAPRIPLDDGLLGTWRCLPVDADADEDPVMLSVTRARENVYGVTWREPGQEPDRYEAFGSSVGGATLLNTQELKADGAKGDWVFVRPTLLRPSVLALDVVSDKALDGVEDTAPALRRAIEGLRSNPALYAGFCVCARAREPES